VDEQLYAHQQLDRDSFATRMHLSRPRLNEILSTNTDGLSFPQWINNIRLEKACDLLQRDSDMSVKEVAAAVGLTPNNLRRLFRQRYNITPTEYRQNFAY
jgi:AraC-like DNA-binding protein